MYGPHTLYVAKTGLWNTRTDITLCTPQNRFMEYTDRHHSLYATKQVYGIHGPTSHFVRHKNRFMEYTDRPHTLYVTKTSLWYLDIVN